MVDPKAETAHISSDIAGSLVPVTKQQAVLMLEASYLWMEMGKFEAARDVLSGAAALMPKSEVPQLALGTLEFSQGRYDKALQAFRVAQRLAPKSPLPRAHAAEALIFMNKGSEALKELVAATKAEPGSDAARFAVELMVLLGIRELAAGGIDLAQRALETAVEQDPNHALAHAHLGQVLYARGNDEGARRTLQRAIELGGASEAAEFARTTLALGGAQK